MKIVNALEPRFGRLRGQAIEKARKAVNRLESVGRVTASTAALNQIVRINVLLDLAITEARKLANHKEVCK